MDDISIRYSFTLEDGSREVFELTLDVGTLELKNATPAGPRAGKPARPGGRVASLGFGPRF